MKKKELIVIILILIIASSVIFWFFNNQIGQQNQISELQNKNDDLQNQISQYEEQIIELELQDREKQDRLEDYTKEIAKERNLNLVITGFVWEGGFHPIVGVTLIHPYNVTIQNDDVVPLFGLTLKATLFRRGIQIGDEGVMQIGRLKLGETEVRGIGPLTIIGTSLESVRCLVELSVGDKIIDEWTHELDIEFVQGF